jgi:tetratricopeptide (TPR) repeat protein
MPKRKKSSQKPALQVPLAPSNSLAPRLRVVAGIALIAVTAFLVYFPALDGGFIWDDNEIYITKNQIIKASDGLYRFWCTSESVEYYPVTNTTFWTEWRLWGMNPTGYHVTNLILHIVESLLIWIILRKLSIPGAFLAALIFAVHPVNVESVAWIAERKDMMAMLFFLLSILCYLKTEIPSSDLQNALNRIASSLSPLPSFLPWYWLSLMAFVLAMLSKGSVTILPVVLLGIVWWLRPLTRWDFVQTAPFLAVAVVLTPINVWFQTHLTGGTIRNANFVERLLDAGGVVWFYLYKALLPINLAFVYPQWSIQAGNLLWWLPFLAALIVTAVLWRYREGWGRPMFFAWGFFCVALVPVMGFADTYFMKYSLVADHYQHIALIGVISLATAVWSVWHQRAQSALHWAATVAVVVAVGALSFLTWRQSGLYHDEIRLYQSTLEINPGCWMAHNNLGAALVQTGRLKEAIEHYEQSLHFMPDYPDAHFNLGIMLLRTGRPQEAIGHYEQALHFMPDYPEAHNNLAVALLRTGRPKEAIEHYEQALRLSPGSFEVYNNLALTYARMHRSSDAINIAQKAMELARSQGQMELAKRIEKWLNSYRAGLSDLPKKQPAGESPGASSGAKP